MNNTNYHGKILFMKKLSKVGIILSFILTTCFLFGYTIKKFHIIDSLFYKKNNQFTIEYCSDERIFAREFKITS